jgi:nucleoside-diphosphate-sugar epimerase
MPSPMVVTGAAGFIGAHLVKALVNNGVHVLALVRDLTRTRRLEVLATGATVVAADVSDAKAVRALFTHVRPQVVFHLAARGVRPGARDRSEMMRTNITGAISVLDAAAEAGAARLVLCGGSSEYGKADLPMSETLRLEPVTAYGASKAAATLLSRQRALELGVSLVVLRPFTVYGPLEPGHRLIPTAIRAALDGKPLSLTKPGLRHDYVFVEDVVQAFLAAATAPVNVAEVFNVGSGTDTTNEEVVAAVEKAAGVQIDVRVGEHQAHAGDHTRWVADTNKARERLGFLARRELAAGITECVAFARMHGTDW